MTLLEQQLLRACLAASTFLQDLQHGKLKNFQRTQEELTQAIQAATAEKKP